VRPRSACASSDFCILQDYVSRIIGPLLRLTCKKQDLTPLAPRSRYVPTGTRSAYDPSGSVTVSAAPESESAMTRAPA
jgi:hypothetical protein